MQGVLTGFGVVGVVIVVGMVLAHVGIADAKGQRLFAQVSFMVATPALVAMMLAKADLRTLFTHQLGASIGSVAAVAIIWLLLGRLVWKRSLPDLVIGAFSSSYVNAANLGLPIAAYVIGDVTAVLPMLLTQVLFLQPLGLTVLDLTLARERREKLTPFSVLTRPFRNPITVGAIVGLLLAVTGLRLPVVINDSLGLLGDLAVPMNLLAFGMSLRLGPRPGRGEPMVQVGSIVALKLIVQPLIGYLLAAHIWHLGPAEVLAVTVIAGLPTAQNVFVVAATYNRALVLARDTVFLTTIGSIASMFIIAVLLH
ncbi:AEC family transporter [Enemella sp. A6]|uniref:AEC family transporter n=1 Tax=Enemella sp. A6 TaxID=3440152 RepID=UPI003EB78A6B